MHSAIGKNSCIHLRQGGMAGCSVSVVVQDCQQSLRIEYIRRMQVSQAGVNIATENRGSKMEDRRSKMDEILSSILYPLSSNHMASAIDAERLARNPAGEIRGEEQDAVSDVFRTS